MVIEADAIPYDAARLRGERLLVLAPHPDDEVIACGGLIAQHLDENRAVRVVVATDGSEAAATSSPAEYRSLREEESRRGLALLGEPVGLHFLRVPDRTLSDDVAPALRQHLVEFKPDLICVPAPIEIHPDHLALSRAFCGLIQKDPTLFADLADARVAFYEVSQTLRPNALVDITAVAERKYAAVGAHRSQTSIRDYVSFVRGLNAYRAMTLPPEVKFAEGYWVAALPALRTTAFSQLRDLTGAPPKIEVARETLPVTVIIRTKDRPELLRQAVESVEANDHPADIIVVNDGGGPVSAEGATVIVHETSRGRSEAMNSGVRAAKSKYVAFLDDDDLFYPEHLSTLASAASASPSSAAWYSDAVSTRLEPGPSGSYEPAWRLRLFANDFDRELLLLDNYIPLPTLLVERDAYLAAGGFDPAFDLFEDWDFLIRLSRRGDFLHVPSVTCEIRHYAGGSSIVLNSPVGSERFRKAKLQVWKKHADLVTNDVIASAFERQKERLLSTERSLVEEKGLRSRAETDISRLEREKGQLIGELQQLHHAVNERTIHIKDLETAIEVLTAEANRADRDLQQLRESEKQLHASLDESQAILRSTYAEIERLQGLLNMIYRSRTWKVHTMLERMKGR